MLTKIQAQRFIMSDTSRLISNKVFRVRPALQRAAQGVQGIHRVIYSLLFDIVFCRVKQFARTFHKCGFSFSNSV